MNQKAPYDQLTGDFECLKSLEDAIQRVKNQSSIHGYSQTQTNYESEWMIYAKDIEQEYYRSAAEEVEGDIRLPTSKELNKYFAQEL